jgi:coenzyme F420-reducing hydrogenase alpha subunit
MKNQITIDPITRLEGHGKIEIFLDKEGLRSFAKEDLLKKCRRS